MVSQMDMYSCLDACTHFNQGEGPQAGLLGDTCCAHMGTHVSMKVSTGGLANMGSQVDIITCSDACTHSKQGVGTEVVTGKQTQCHTGEPMFPCNYA